MNERTLSKTQFLLTGDPDSPLIQTFRRKRESALFTKDGKFQKLMTPKTYHKLSDDLRRDHQLQTVWILLPN